MPNFVFPATAGEVGKILERETGYMAFTQVPRTLPDRFIKVARLGGDYLNPFTESVNIFVEVWNKSKVDAEQVAQQCRGLVFGLRGYKLAGYKVHNVEGDGGISDEPDPPTATPRFTFTATLVIKGKRA